jgi:hypothetical protein
VLCLERYKINTLILHAAQGPTLCLFFGVFGVFADLPEPGLGTRRINESDAETSFSADSQVGCSAHGYIIDIMICDDMIM